jgi:uncharacterized protein (TIGR02996 family)
MTHNEAFLRAIREAPDDDVPRLIYADWLDDHGQSDRAELIRVQIERSHLPVADPRRVGLASRAADLLRAHWQDWVGPLRALVNSDGAWVAEHWLLLDYDLRALERFRRGFVESLTLRTATFLRTGEELARLEPIHHLRLWRTGPLARDLAACPALAGLTTLDFADRHQAPLDDAGAEALSRSPHLGQLTTLHLAHNNLGDAGLAALAGAPWLANLRTLDLIENGFSIAGVKALAGRPLRLTTLLLARNLLGDAALVELAGSPGCSRLTTLDLRSCQLGAAAVAALAASPYLGQLSHLDLERNSLGAEGVARLSAAPWLNGLTTLNLSWCELGDAGVEALAQLPNLANLRNLNLSANGLSDRAAHALANSPHLLRLERLEIGRSPAITAAGANQLHTSSRLRCAVHGLPGSAP